MNHRFAICIDNHGFEASLEPRKLYLVVPDAEAEGMGQLRVVDESGEDYLYPATSFDQVALPDAIAERVLLAIA